MTEQKTQLYFFTFLFLGALALTFFIFLPFLGSLAVAAVTAVIFYPFYLRIHARIKSEAFASVLALLLVIGVVLVPLGVFGFLLFSEARELFSLLSSGGTTEITEYLTMLEGRIAELFPAFSVDLSGYLRQALGFLTSGLGSVFAGTAEFVLALLLGMIALYYFFKDGSRFTRALIAYSPLEDSHDTEILEKLRLTVNSVIKGSLAIALIQGTLTGIGFSIFGIPNPALWGGVAALAALIPGVGTTLVLVPAILFLFFTGATGSAFGLLVWGVIAVGLIDNFLGPVLIGRGVRIHPFFILLSVLGGLRFFGPIGLLLGPLSLSLLVALSDIYSSLVRARIDSK